MVYTGLISKGKRTLLMGIEVGLYFCLFLEYAKRYALSINQV